MSIYLGNLSIEEIEKRIGIEIPKDLKEDLIKTRQENADTNKLKENEWHCFDIPFVFVCGSMNFAKKIFNVLNKFSDKIKTPMQISINKEQQ